MGPEAFFVTQLDPHLNIEWRFQNTNTQSCTRNADGTISCKTSHLNGFEWCVNAPVVDMNGVVYANSEDGNLYAIQQGGTSAQRIFQNLALGAAYTPVSIDSSGRIYSQNDGVLFIVTQ
jgi:outer membrane protein assembly factor BamB